MNIYLADNMDDLTRHKIKKLLNRKGLYYQIDKSHLAVSDNLFTSDFCIEMQEVANVVCTVFRDGMMAQPIFIGEKHG